MPQQLGGSADTPAPLLIPDPAWDEIQASWRDIEADLPSGLCRFGPDAPIGHLIAAIRRDGCIIMEHAVPDACCDAVVSELSPYLEVTETGDGFLGRQTQRVGAVVARSSASWQILCHPTLLRLCDGILSRQVLSLSREELAERIAPGNHQFGFQLSLSQLISIGDGNRDQPLHRDGWGFVLDLQASKIEAEISTIWAMDDFNLENGATRLVLGSHKWDRKRTPGPTDEVSRAVMPKGSVVVYLGSMWHGGGKNSSGVRRNGLNVDYNLGPLRTEENMYLAAPPYVARDFPEPLQRLVGYTMSGTSFGYFGEYQHPKEALLPNAAPINWAAKKATGREASSGTPQESKMEGGQSRSRL